MQVDNWTKSFAQLFGDIDRLEKQQGTANLPLRTKVLQKNSAVLQFEAAIHRLRGEIDFAKNKNFSKDPKPAAVIHWCEAIAKNILETYESSSGYLSKQLWISLIRARMSQTMSDETLMEDVDLLALGTRELELKKLEKRCEKELLYLHDRKKELEAIYNRLDTRSSNDEAGRCLQNDGRNRDAASGATMEDSLSSLITDISNKVYPANEVGKKLKSLEHRLIDRTDKIMSDCRTMIAKDIDPDKITVGDRRIEKLEHDLLEVEGLSHEVDQLRQQLNKYRPRTLKPIMMQKSKNRVTKGGNV